MPAVSALFITNLQPLKHANSLELNSNGVQSKPALRPATPIDGGLVPSIVLGHTFSGTLFARSFWTTFTPSKALYPALAPPQQPYSLCTYPTSLWMPLVQLEALENAQQVRPFDRVVLGHSFLVAFFSIVPIVPFFVDRACAPVGRVPVRAPCLRFVYCAFSICHDCLCRQESTQYDDVMGIGLVLHSDRARYSPIAALFHFLSRLIAPSVPYSIAIYIPSTLSSF